MVWLPEELIKPAPHQDNRQGLGKQEQSLAWLESPLSRRLPDPTHSRDFPKKLFILVASEGILCPVGISRIFPVEDFDGRSTHLL
jgi:hypothetical protein